MIRMIDNPIDIKKRKNKECVGCFAQHDKSIDYLSIVESLPRVLAGQDMRDIINAFMKAKLKKQPIIIMLGGHVIKCGLQPFLKELMELNAVDLIATTGAAVIHDTEFALYGETSEHVEEGLLNGTYGCANEPLDFINNAISEHDEIISSSEQGYGSVIGLNLCDNSQYPEYSLFAEANRLNFPITVHIALGTDINQMHSGFDCEKAALASYNDFRLLAQYVEKLGNGMVFNCGSAVILPEVFLKSLAIAANKKCNLKFTGVNMDFQKQYRSNAQIVEKAELFGGKGYNLIGHHEIQIPLLFGAILQKIRSEKNGEN